MDKTGIGANVECDVVRIGDVHGAPRIKTHWEWEQWRDGKIIDQWAEGNICVDEGLNHMLDVTFSSGTQETTWYIAIFNNDYTPLAGNTYASPGYTESTAYDESPRPIWQEGGVSSKSITNSANKANFTINDSETIYGAALVSGGTPGDMLSGEVLFCSSKFTSSRAVVDDDILKVTITLTAADA